MDRLCHYTLRDESLENINARRRPRNKLVFALQLCVLRYSGRLLAPSKLVARPVVDVDFIGRQLGLDGTTSRATRQGPQPATITSPKCTGYVE